MKFYIENQNGEKVYEGTQEDCTKEIDRLISSSEYGYWQMFDETDPNETWQEGGLVEVKEKMDDYDYWHQPYNYQRSFFTPEVCPTRLALDGGDSAPFQAVSYASALSTSQAESNPTHRK